jgi:hypothetical protein
MWGTILNALLGKAIPAAADFFLKKEELKQAREIEKLKGKIEFERMKTQRFSESLTADSVWELESIRNSGWKDEWVLILLSIPLVLVFFPVTQSYVLDGFKVLETTPDWYRWMVMMIFGAIYGIRIWRRKL